MSKSKSLSDVIRETIERDGRTIYRLSLDSGVNQAVLGRFVRGERDMNLRTADRVCRALGLELRPVRTKAKGD
jgi:DNA-binding phage protein